MIRMLKTIRTFSHKLKWLTVGGGLAVYLLINLLHFGGDDFVINLNNLIVVPFALGATILAFSLWWRTGKGDQSRPMWAGLTMGWALWSIAEGWWAVAALIDQVVHYPSVADVLWLAGYLPIYYAFWSRIRSLPEIVRPIQRLAMWATSLGVFFFTLFFILLPILQNNDPNAFWESVLNVLYPLADIALLLLVLKILFTYEGGMYGAAWRWLGLGFIFFAAGDLAFTYTNSHGLYYPDQQVNFISSFLVDIPYNLSYVLCITAMLILRELQSIDHHTSNDPAHLDLIANTHLFISTRTDDSLGEVSQNFAYIFAQGSVVGKNLTVATGIAEQDSAAIFEELHTSSQLAERTVTALTRFGRLTVHIAGIAVLNADKQYAGSNLLIRLLVDDYTIDQRVSETQKSLIKKLLANTGVQQIRLEEIKTLLAQYYSAYLWALYNRVLLEGGATFGKAFINALQTTLKDHDEVLLSIGTYVQIDVQALSLNAAVNILTGLFETARTFTIRLTNQEIVDEIGRGVEARFGETALKNVYYGIEIAKTA